MVSRRTTFNVCGSAILKFNLREDKFCKHFIHSTPCNQNENETKSRANNKMTVVKRIFSKDKQTCTELEWKDASDVIKRLNFENKHLFGPLLRSKYDSFKNDNVKDYNLIVQHETRIPIIDELNETDSCEPSNKLCSVLSFPLANKSIHPTDKIEEFNYLRKHLLYLCDNTFPSVTSILQKTMPAKSVEALERWRTYMISKLGEEGFKKYQAELFEKGNSLHQAISSFLSSTPESELLIKKEILGHWRSLDHIFLNIRQVKLLEEFVTHPFLCYRGVVDCFAKYKDQLVVIDWKTSTKSKASIKDVYDNPLQIAAYVGALNFDPKFQYLASKGLIVIAYENGSPATAHFLRESDMKHYWNEWLKRLKEFWEIKKSEKVPS